MTSTTETRSTTPTTGGVMYVGPSLSRSLVGVAVALATGKRPEGSEPDAPFSDAAA